ncbi:MAG: hypothetical protein LQ339_007142 [Xanthoria mediterranea]|nr:MAG: hypothetical protein LQ339_007142 [Xanthoria mediterranea]
MATIKAIEGRSIHQIQSGQVVIDLCSVVKELVENSLDAGATSIEVRFKANGLDSIEVQDNGHGISKENYDTVALKHCTSKLSNYDDLSSLQTFGFRGEALSSLCALSNLQILTAQTHEAPKGTRLDFESSGELKATSVIASQKGTTVIVEALFANLPVRRQELERNIKREYTKVLGVLQAYACISASVKFAVSNILAKGKKVVIFATKSNVSTRESIANVFGAKTLSALVSMDLRFDLQDTKNKKYSAGKGGPQVGVVGHVSRPVVGEGRQTPDRQMFFVNARPCTLPQFAKVFNEVYKSYNVSQSPFVFANIIIDTDAYDVNVSPDKRTILLHEQTALLESLRIALVELFEHQDQTVPQTQRTQSKLPTFKPLVVQRQSSALHAADFPNESDERTESSLESSNEGHDSDRSEVSNQETWQSTGIIGRFAGRDAQARYPNVERDKTATSKRTMSAGKQKLVHKLGNPNQLFAEDHDYDDKKGATEPLIDEESQDCPPNSVADFNRRIAEQERPAENTETGSSERHKVVESAKGNPTVASKSTPPRTTSGPLQNAFDRMRPRREQPQIATITIGEKTTTTVIGSAPLSFDSSNVPSVVDPNMGTPEGAKTRERFSSSMRAFAASGVSLSDASSYCTPSPANRSFHEAVTPINHASAASPASVANLLERAPERAHFSSDEEHTASENGDEILEDGKSDEPYEDDEGRNVKQNAKVADLIKQAEAKLAAPSEDDSRRAGLIPTSRGPKDSTTQLLQTLHVSVTHIEEMLRNLERGLRDCVERTVPTRRASCLEEEEGDAETKLSLKVSKADFSRMDIIGQFNLGFILATRPSTSPATDDEVFIVDQHAADEKYNFERLQASTTVQSQRLVRPKLLDLTAIDEEIIIENNAALLENGFVINVDQGGDAPVGQRCRVLSLPMSREVTFDLSDLEELISLLGESPLSMSDTSTTISGHRLPPRHVPRPSKIRKLFAMRACRSSVMIGKTLQKRQMEKLIRHMGEIDKPWNCPHGRPTMRHLAGLRDWEGWKEGDGLVEHANKRGREAGELVDWGLWLAEGKDNEHAERESDEEKGDEGDKVSDHDGDGGPIGEGEAGLHSTEDDFQTGGDDAMLDSGLDDVEATNDSRDADESEGSDEEMEESGDEEDWWANARQSISQRFTFS